MARIGKKCLNYTRTFMGGTNTRLERKAGKMKTILAGAIKVLILSTVQWHTKQNVTDVDNGTDWPFSEPR